MKDHLLLSQKTLKVGEGLRMLTSACGGEGMPLRGDATPLQKGELGAGVANTAPTGGPRVCLFCLVDTSC